MIIFDSLTANSFKNLNKKLESLKLNYTKLDDIDQKTKIGEFATCIFKLDKSFFELDALYFLKNQTCFDKLSIILVSNRFQNSQVAINYIKALSELHGYHYDVVSEIDDEDDEYLFELLTNKSDNSKENKVVIYTDGACSGNPGAGGWAAILIGENNKNKTISGGETQTTNNRMELMAVIEGLKQLKKTCSVELFSDSAYVVNAFELGWLKQWKSNGWKTSSKGEVKNIDLWQELDELIQKHNVHFNKVKGHADNKFNNECDRLAVLESQKYINN